MPSGMHAECRIKVLYAERPYVSLIILSVTIQNVIMLIVIKFSVITLIITVPSVIMLNVIILSVVMLNVVVPYKTSFILG
jgi:hypothetical protein